MFTNKKSTSTLSSFSHTYYLDGNQASKTDSTGRNTAYEYDGLGRLTKETEKLNNTLVFSKAYTYDKANNRKTMVVSGEENYTTSYDYDLNNRLKTETKVKALSTETAEYQYDNNGNQISKMTYSVGNGTGSADVGIYVLGLHRPTPRENYTVELNEYDVFNRLVGVQNDEGISIYTYKPDGSNIVLEFGASNDVYLRGINLIKSNNYGYYLFNAHGDVVQLANASGAITKNYLYDAFGVEKDKDENDTNPFRYCGEYLDLETNTYYLRARNYNPTTGRFLSEDTHWNPSNMIYGDNPKDPLGLNIYTPEITAIMQSGNLYVYGLNNPLMYQDPSGNIVETIFDIGSTLWSAWDLITDPSWANAGFLLLELVG